MPAVRDTYGAGYSHAMTGKAELEINYVMDPTGEKEKRASKENLDRRNTSSHDNKKLETRPTEKQRGMAFGFWKTATAVIKADR